MSQDRRLATEIKSASFADLDAVTERYQALVAVLTVGIFSTGLPVYLYGTGRLGFAPIHWVYFLALLAMPIAFRPDALVRSLHSRLFVWCGVYLIGTLIAFLISSRSSVAVQELQVRVLATVAVPTFALVFSSVRAINAARTALAVALVVGVGLNLYEAVHPQTFSFVYGRSAGLYLNPNISATALTVGLTLCVGAIAARWREPFAAFVGLGVLLTLSRGQIIAYVLAVLVLWHGGAVRAGRMFAIGTLVGLGGALVIVLSLGVDQAAAALRVLTQGGLLDRILNPSVAFGGADYSANLRLEEARAAWQQFMESPLLGQGVGSTIEWSVHSSTHNIYLRHVAEYGVLGIFLFPALIIAVVAGTHGPARGPLLAFAIAVLTAGMFSHNVLDEWDMLVALALAGSMAVESRRSHAPTERTPSARARLVAG